MDANGYVATIIADTNPEESTESQQMVRQWLDQSKPFVQPTSKSLLRHWWQGAPARNVGTLQDCQEVLSGHLTSAQWKDALYGAKLSFLGYAFPFLFTQIAPLLDLPNRVFTTRVRGIMASDSFQCFHVMDQILSGEIQMITLPTSTLVSGFYIRTPIRLFAKDGSPLTHPPPWPQRLSLLNGRVEGNNNAYVLRRNLPNNTHELYILFRGIANEFNSLSQYGKSLSKTQLFQCPDFDIDKEQKVPQGSDTIPLFYHSHWAVIKDLEPHLLKSITRLDGENATRILVCGHSLGGALAIVLGWMWRNDPIFAKLEFRVYGTPLCSNDPAVWAFEELLIQSKRSHKFIEVVNTDDVVQVQYVFGGNDTLQQSIESGTYNTLQWALTRDPALVLDKNVFQRGLRVLQRSPQTAVALLLNGFNEYQGQQKPNDKRFGVRMGARANERVHWKHLRKWYQDYVALILCRRRIDESLEFPGKSHTEYLDVNTSILWRPLRQYEDALYADYVVHSLQENNELRIVGLFAQPDVEKAKEMTHK